jgi:hypothetical protein
VSAVMRYDRMVAGRPDVVGRRWGDTRPGLRLKPVAIPAEMQ